MKKKSKFQLQALFLISLLILVGLFFFFRGYNQIEKKYSNCSPDDLSSQFGGTYCLQVIDRVRGKEKFREFWITKSSNSDRGKKLLSFSSEFVWDKKQEMNLEVVWEPNGFSFMYDQLLIFVPKEKLSLINNF